MARRSFFLSLRMTINVHHRRGTTMVEFLLFLVILALILGTIAMFLAATEESRIRQRSIAEVEENGAKILQSITRQTRRAEAILVPLTNKTGSILMLQMAQQNEYPTIYAMSGSRLMVVLRDDIANGLPPTVQIKNLVFRNLSGTTSKSIDINFDLEQTVPLPKSSVYKKHFQAAATLYPDDRSDAGGCGSCPAPTCVSHVYKWSICTPSDTCATATGSLVC